jgi:hypothetical protein
VQRGGVEVVVDRELTDHLAPPGHEAKRHAAGTHRTG